MDETELILTCNSGNQKLLAVIEFRLMLKGEKE
jgi:hypothetical protein